jgi:hypothetical protein
MEKQVSNLTMDVCDRAASIRLKTHPPLIFSSTLFAAVGQGHYKRWRTESSLALDFDPDGA